MAGTWRRRGEPSTQLLGAVVAYLRLLEAEWESLSDAQRRSAIRLALEAVCPAPRRSREGDDAPPAPDAEGAVRARGRAEGAGSS